MSCFPRASGDGPRTWNDKQLLETFPPRERGWSRAGACTLREVAVSPARAGMVLHRGFLGRLGAGFPRASGDGPHPARCTSTPSVFPPRERGWSRVSVGCCNAAPVSPARAGMVPQGTTAAQELRSFPRASGDGPAARALQRRSSTFPPRERGWSPAVRRSRGAPAVSPARAGMVPCRTLRKDRPQGFPRASGDGPLIPAAQSGKYMFPPRERGWSLREVLVQPLAAVSPARAGMVPHSTEAGVPRGGFPRASGDGPSALSFCLNVPMFPPRERGWSHDYQLPPTSCSVSPARAGMVP